VVVGNGSADGDRAMEQQRWRQIEQLYHSAKERDPDRRHAYLTEVCRGDEDLRREIESLLAQDTSRDCVLDRPAAELIGDSTASQFAAATHLGPDRLDPFVPGTLLGGRFRIIRAAGAGGMGIVYEALDEKLNQRVALKGAKPGYGDHLPPEARAAREVSHFNVCKVHDLHVASTPLGEMEFLSMEFIDGPTLSEQIDRDGPVPEPEAREIARQICAGLAQAHRQGVIHGDLKPGNILIVRTPQSAPRVVITDFGIATLKIVEGAPVLGGQGGTPDYMAPELFLGEPSTVASDLYALGILFHVMLTGRSPKRTGTGWGRRGTPWVRLPTASKPDSQAETITAGPVIVAADWQRTIEDLPPPWSGLVARCIAPRPEERYSSADAVSYALQPRRLLLKGSALAAAVAALTFGYWQWSAPPAGPPVRLAVLPFSVQGDPVPSAGGIGLDVADRLSGARRNFTVISPREAQRNGVETPQNAKRMLGATHVLETRLRRSGATIVAAATLTDLASGRTLGQPLNGTYAAGDAAALAKAILATATGAFQLRSRVPVESVAAAAYPQYVQGMELLRQDDYNSDKAIPYFEKAIELDPRSALPYAGLADAQIQMFDKREGPKWLEMAAANVAKAEAINADSVPVLLVSGAFQESHGAYEPALRAFTRATALDPSNPEAWRRLAGAYDKAHRTDEAIATYRRAMKAQPNYYGNYLSLGNLYWYRTEFREAEELYRRVTTIAPDLSSGHIDLGVALMAQGRFPEAEASLLRALRLRRSSMVLMNIGGLYYDEERYAEACRFFEESVASGTPSAIRYRDLGDVYRHLGRSRESTKAYRLARDMAQDEITRNPQQADSRVLLALVSARLGDSSTALFEARQALSFEPENAIVMREAVLMYEVLHQREEALQVLRRAPRGLLGELSRQPDVKGLQQDARFQELIQAQVTR
jgi:serine/threonine protein kinase/tetratricopeptide (TPR) repeat protein